MKDQVHGWERQGSGTNLNLEARLAFSVGKNRSRSALDLGELQFGQLPKGRSGAKTAGLGLGGPGGSHLPPEINLHLPNTVVHGAVQAAPVFPTTPQTEIPILPMLFPTNSG